MAFRDIDYSLRVNGDLSVPSHSLKVGSNITINSADGKLSATQFAGNGSLLTNLSSSAMTDVLKLDGTRKMTSGLSISATGAHFSFEETGVRKWHMESVAGTFKLVESGVASRISISAGGFTSISGSLGVAGNINTSNNISAATINATSNLQENGTNLSAKYEAKGTLHDDRYYTETEMDTKLSGKSDTTHNHDTTYSALGHAHAWSEVTGKPTSFAPSAHSHAMADVTGLTTALTGKSDTGHTHDDRYYTESEMDTKLSTKSDTGHAHAWSEITSKPTTFTPSAHTHDDRYYTEAEMDTKLDGKMSYGDVVMNTNPFGGKQLFINSVNNAMFRAESRWVVSGTKHLVSDDSVVTPMDEPSLSGLFNGDYEGGVRINAGEYLKVHIDFNGGNFPGYPYGNLYMSHYYVNHSASAVLRVYCNYEPHGIGWHEMPFADYMNSGANLISKARNGKYGISEMEFIIHAPATEYATITQIDWQLDRPGSVEMPIVDKFRNNSLYSDLYFKDITNTVNASITRGGSGSFTSLTVNGTNVSLAGHTHDDRYYTETEMDTKLSGKSDTSHSHTFASVTSKPTTLSGYGITDAAASGHTHTFASITSKPTTLTGYGITDAAAASHNHDTVYAPMVHNHDTAYAAKTHSHSEYSTTSHNHDANYAARGTRTQSVRAWDKRSWTPTEASTATGEFIFNFTSLNNDSSSPYADAITMSSYGDGSAGGNNMLLAAKDGSGLYLRFGQWEAASWSWTKKLAFDEDKADKSTSITAGTGLSGGGDLSASRTLNVTFGTTAGTAAEGNHGHSISNVSGLQSALDGKSASGHTHTFSSLTSKPTTLAGYGITDAATSSHNHDSTYLKLIGGTLTSTLTLGAILQDSRITTGNKQLINVSGSTGATIYVGNPATALALEGTTLHFNANLIYHSGNFNPADKADASAVTTHINNSSIHKDWGFWATAGGGTDLTVNSKRALVHVVGTNKLMLNYAGDFTGGVEINGALTNGGYDVWHKGNLSTSSFVTTTDTGQKVKENFTVLGRTWIGDGSGSSGVVGSLVVKGNTVAEGVQNAIQLGGATSLSNVKAFISETGSARFQANVRVASLTIDTTALIPNLNAEYVGGVRETNFVRTDSVRDIHGYGIKNGMTITQKSPTPDMTITVKAGIAYTDSGRRFQYEDTTVPITTASQNYDRYDIVFIQGSTVRDTDGSIISNRTNEGRASVRTGAATQSPVADFAGLANEYPNAIVLGTIYVRANIGTITDGTSGTYNAVDTSARKLMSLRLTEGDTYTVNEKLTVGGKITEAGKTLESKYAQLATDNAFAGNHFVEGGLVQIKASYNTDTTPATLSFVEDTGSTLHGFSMKYFGGGNYFSISGKNSNVDTEFIKVNRSSGKTDFVGSVWVGGYVTASRNATQLSIPAGTTSATWTHNYGNANYAVNLTTNSFERHVRWKDKTANSITIEIDDPSSQDILVDCILIGY